MTSVGQRAVFQSLGQIRSLQCRNHFLEVAFHKPIQIVKSKPGAVVGNAVLRKVVSADFFFAATRSDLTPAMGRIFLRFFTLFGFEQTRAQNIERFLLVLLLAPSVLAADDCTLWNMQNLHCGISRVHALAAWSARATNFNAKLFRF